TGSMAIGNAGAVSISVDQRNFPLDSPPDIGAFQFHGPTPTVTIVFTGPTPPAVLQEENFTLTATDPTPADQNGTFTYTINWGDGSAIETVTGPASTQVMHDYAA